MRQTIRQMTLATITAVLVAAAMPLAQRGTLAPDQAARRWDTEKELSRSRSSSAR